MIQRTPRPDLVRVTDALDEAVKSFLDARNAIQPDTTWEAPLEAWAISNLMIRNIEAAIVLARHDEVLAPAAWANARNVFDAATRILWLLAPADRFVSETHWIALLDEYARFHTRMAKAQDVPAEVGARHRAQAQQIQDFRDGVMAALPSGYEVPTRIPGTDVLLEDLRVGGMYQLYIQGSQYMHATMSASSLYRKNLGDSKEFGDFVDIYQWILPLRTCWISLHNAGRFVVSRLRGTDEWDTDSTDLRERVDEAFRKLALAEPG